MPAVRKQGAEDPVLAIVVSDVHLSLTPPLARRCEKDWLAAQKRVWDEISDLRGKYNASVICAGDLFDRWNPPIELVNWALDHLPHMFAIPGNHDLPSHRPELEHRSGFGTLVRARKIQDLTQNPCALGIPGLNEIISLHGRAIDGIVPTPSEASKDDLMVILVTHEYLWVPGATYRGAPQEQRLGMVSSRFKGFDVVIVGDNHIQFSRLLKSKTRVYNCGTPIRRKSDEADYKPSVGLLHASGKVTPHYLDTSKDAFSKSVTAKEEREEDESIQAFVERLSHLEDTDLNYRESLTRAMRGAPESVRRVLLEAMNAVGH
jgi:DNA repair exonuclease SbcCD nuclease subunit